MTWKPKKQEVAATGLAKFWEDYGTWISGAVTVVLAVVLVVVLVRRYNESRLAKGQAELSAISPEDAGARMQLKRLAAEYGDTRLGPQIQLKLALVMCRAGEYEEAEKTLEAVRGDARLSDIERSQVNLTRGYAAQERAAQAGRKGDPAMEKTLLDEARKHYEAVKDDPLYGAEAKHMLEVLDRAAAAPVAAGTPATPK
jgi:hypothetical protein